MTTIGQSNRARMLTFIAESNMIEGIGHARPGERDATAVFLSLDRVELVDIIRLVQVYQPDARLRNIAGLNVRVGDHIAPPGGPEIPTKLEMILNEASNGRALSPWQIHCEYEDLHPFTDGNGRSGRALWLWMMYKRNGELPSLGFLHTFYYQTLSERRVEFG